MNIKISKPKCLWKTKTLLGEGTLWIPKLNSILFVDIKKNKIFILNTRSKKKKIIKTDKKIGFVSHVKKNVFALGLKSEIRIVNLHNKKIIFSLKIEANNPSHRLNDGKTDPEGRLWFGTMNDLERKPTGSLYCLDKSLKLHKVDRNYFTPNGPAFLNKNNFYHTDSRKRVIYKIRINNKFKIIKKTNFIKFNKIDGSPDGMTTDIKNNLWVCHYRGGIISVYNKKGNRIHNINLPAKNITNCTFGGINNKELYISTARNGMNKKEISKFPLSGGLFKLTSNSKGKKTKSFKVKI